MYIIRWITILTSVVFIGFLAWGIWDVHSAKNKAQQVVLPALRAQVTDIVLGNPAASHRLVIFSDFRCSRCARAYSILKDQILPLFGDKIFVIYKDFPSDGALGLSQKIAAGARCATVQGFGAETLSYLFKFEGQVGTIELENMPQALSGLNQLAWNSCRIDTFVAEKINESMRLGFEWGITRLPAIFLNEKPINLAEFTPEGIKSRLENLKK